MLQTIGWYIGGFFGVLGMVCWFGMFVFGFWAKALRKPGVSWFSPSLHDGSGYTEEGLRVFKRGWVCVLGFLICVSLAIIIGTLTGAGIQVER